MRIFSPATVKRNSAFWLRGSCSTFRLRKYITRLKVIIQVLIPHDQYVVSRTQYIFCTAELIRNIFSKILLCRNEARFILGSTNFHKMVTKDQFQSRSQQQIESSIKEGSLPSVLIFNDLCLSFHEFHFFIHTYDSFHDSIFFNCLINLPQFPKFFA